MARTWNRQHRKTKFDPGEILIAGEDFDPSEADRADLRDSPSRAREALDPDMIQDFLENGYKGAIEVVPHLLPGESVPVPVVTSGRRRLRHLREVNRILRERGQPPREVEIILVPGKARGFEAFDNARAENMAGMPETPAQLIDYVQQYDKYGTAPEHICFRLQLRTPDGKPDLRTLEKYRALGSVTVSEALRDALDMRRIPLTAALEIADDPALQAKVLAKKGSIKVRDVLAAKAESRGRTARKARSAKEIKAALKRDDLPEDVKNVLRWVRGEIEDLL